LIKLYNVRTHPGLKESVYNQAVDGASNGNVDETTSVNKDATAEKKEVIALNFYKYRMDKNSMAVTFKCLPHAA